MGIQLFNYRLVDFVRKFHFKTGVSQEGVADLVSKLVAFEHIVRPQVHHQVQVALLNQIGQHVFLGSVHKSQSGVHCGWLQFSSVEIADLKIYQNQQEIKHFNLQYLHMSLNTSGSMSGISMTSSLGASGP